MTMDSNIVKFPYSASRRVHSRRPRKSKNGTPEERATLQELVAEDARPPARSLSATAENGVLRKERHEIWRMAEAATRYWRLRLDFEYAVSWAQQMEVPEGSFHPAVNPGDRPRNVERYRASLVKQLLTPARMVRLSSGNKRR